MEDPKPKNYSVKEKLAEIAGMSEEDLPMQGMGEELLSKLMEKVSESEHLGALSSAFLMVSGASAIGAVADPEATKFLAATAVISFIASRFAYSQQEKKRDEIKEEVLSCFPKMQNKSETLKM